RAPDAFHVEVEDLGDPAPRLLEGAPGLPVGHELPPDTPGAAEQVPALARQPRPIFAERGAALEVVAPGAERERAQSACPVADLSDPFPLGFPVVPVATEQRARVVRSRLELSLLLAQRPRAVEDGTQLV